MKFLGPVLAGCILAGAGAAQAAVVHHFDGGGSARFPSFYDDQPVASHGYTGYYNRVDVTITVSTLGITPYGVVNDGDVPVTLPVTVWLSVDMAGPGIYERIGASQSFDVWAAANSSRMDDFWDDWSLSRSYSFTEPQDLAPFSSYYNFWGEGIVSVSGRQGEAWARGISPVFFTVSVDYLSEVPVPAPALLLLSGLGGAAAFVRRRRR